MSLSAKISCLSSAYTELEHQLEALGLRWTGVCKWVEERWLLLSDVLTKWEAFSEHRSVFTDWLGETEDILSNMRTGPSDLSDIGQVVEQVQYLKVSNSRRLNSFTDLILSL